MCTGLKTGTKAIFISIFAAGAMNIVPAHAYDDGYYGSKEITGVIYGGIYTSNHHLFAGNHHYHYHYTRPHYTSGWHTEGHYYRPRIERPYVSCWRLKRAVYDRNGFVRKHRTIRLCR